MKAITIELPTECDDGYVPTRVDTTITEEQGRIIKSIILHGRRHGLRTKSGRLVDSSGMALRWLLEQLSSEVRRASENDAA